MENLLVIVFKFLFYFLYRLVHSIIQVESDLISLFRKLSQSNGNETEFLHIIARYKLDVSDSSREQDFLVFNDGFGSFEEICSEKWHIYCISDQYVYFVRTSAEDISISHNSKLENILFETAEKMARMDLALFIEKSKSLAATKCRTVCIHSNPCSGATITSKLLQAADPSQKLLLVLGEAPFLTSLGILSQFISIEKIRALTKASLKYSLQHYDKSQVIVLKARSNCVRIIPYIHHANVSIQHIFVSSRNPSDSIARLVENTSKQLPLFKMICEHLLPYPAICDFFTNWRILERDTVAKIGPLNAYEFAMAHVMAATINYQRNLKYFALDTVFFEDLMNDTATSIRPLLEICELSDLVIPECIAWKRREEPTLREIWDTVPLTEENKERIKHLVQLLQHDWNY